MGYLSGNGVEIMIENITLGNINSVLVFIVGFCGVIFTIYKTVKNTLLSGMEKGLQPINEKIDKMDKKIDRVDMNHTKNFLVARLSELDDGVKLDDVSLERFWEEYEHYKEIGGNTYIQKRVEKLQKEGKL